MFVSNVFAGLVPQLIQVKNTVSYTIKPAVLRIFKGKNTSQMQTNLQRPAYLAPRLVGNYTSPYARGCVRL